MVSLFILLLSFTVTFVRVECLSQNCSLSGLCDGHLQNAGVQDDLTQCILFCRSVQDCTWFSWNKDEKICLALADCLNLDESKTNTISGEKLCSPYSCSIPGLCHGIIIDDRIVRNEAYCLELCQQESQCYWYSYIPKDNLCLLLKDCPEIDSSCSSCVSGQQGCQNDETELNNLMVGAYTFHARMFEAFNLDDSNIPATDLPEYPFPIENPAEMVFDENKGIVRACGGEIPTYFHGISSPFSTSSTYTNLCFAFDGISWKTMASLLEPWSPVGHSRFSVNVPNIGWWLLKDNCSANCNTIHSNLFTNNNTWIVGPTLPDNKSYGYDYTPFNFCGAQVNATHTMVTGGNINYKGTSISDVWLYNWQKDQWSPGPNMTIARRYHTCVGIPGGGVMVAGGIGVYAEDLISIEIFDPAMANGAGGWYVAGDLPEDDFGNSWHVLLYNNNPIWINGQRIWLYKNGDWSLYENKLQSHVNRKIAALIPKDFFP